MKGWCRPCGGNLERNKTWASTPQPYIHTCSIYIIIGSHFILGAFNYYVLTKKKKKTVSYNLFIVFKNMGMVRDRFRGMELYEYIIDIL